MANYADDRFVEVARFGRPHGLEGEIKLLPNNYFDEKLIAENEVLYFTNERDDIMPARVQYNRIEYKSNQFSFFVKLDVINDRSDADSFKDRRLLADKNEIPNPEITKTDNLSGYKLVYEGQSVGSVLNTLENPAHLIIEAETKYGMMLIPFVDIYIRNVDHDNNEILCINLDQLL